MIGDILASHLSLEVIKLCHENNINFVFLPQNSIHLCQPLDAAIFRPINREWRRILDSWKDKNFGIIPKTEIYPYYDQIVVCCCCLFINA